MRHEIPTANWTSHLADAIEQAADNDTIVCHSPDMVALAERAQARMCPAKKLVFELARKAEEGGSMVGS